MDRRVSGIHKLSGNEAARNFLSQLIGFGNSALHAFGAFRQHNFRTVVLQNIAALNAHGFRHGQNDAIAFRSSDRRQTNTGVAGSRFNNYGTGFQQPFFFRVFDHRLGNPVFYAASRVKILQLDQKCRFQSQLFFNIDNFNERRVADQP